MIAAAFAGLSVLGGAMQAFGQIQAGNAAKDAAEFNAGQYEQTAKLALQGGKEAVRRIGVQEEETQSQVEAGFASSGIDTTQGSPLLVLAHNAREFALAKLQTAHAAEVQSIQAGNSAAIQRFQGKTAQENSRYAAAGSLLGSFGSAGRALSPNAMMTV